MSTELNSPSPRLKGLSRLRRNKDPTNASTASFSSTGEDSAGNGSGRARNSVDAAIGKIKERTSRRSSDDRRGSTDSTGKRLSKLVPGSRRGSKKDESAGLSRESSVQSDPAAHGVFELNRNRSDLSLQDGSGNSSLMTEDYSDNDA